MGARSRTLKYLPGHLLRFGIAAVSRDEVTGDVEEAVCLFCRHFGREQRADKKRRSSSTVKYFRDSFRPDQYTQHHQLQHPSHWRNYKACSDDEKRRFFPDTAESVSNTNSNAGSSDAGLLLPKIKERGRCFDLKASIVEIVAVLAVGLGPVEPTVLTRDRLVYQYMTHHNYEGEVPSNCPRWSPPPNTFESCYVVQKEPPIYRVVLFDRTQMDVLTELAAGGMSAAQISSSVKVFRHHAPMLLGGLDDNTEDEEASPDYNEAQTAEFLRLGVAASLSIVARILEESWAFSLDLCTVARHSEFSYLDVRIKFYNRIGGLRSAHFLAIPRYVGKCDIMMFRTLSRALTALLPDWKVKLLGITADGDIPFPVRLLDVIEHFQDAVTGSTLYRTLSCCNQLQRILHTFYASIDGGAFLSTLKKLSECVRKEPIVLSELNGDPGCLEHLKTEVQITGTPSSLLAFGQEIEMLVAHSSYIRGHWQEIEFSSDIPIVIPQSWWLALQVLRWITARANAVFGVLEKQHVAISQQATVMASLAEECITGFHAEIHEKQAHDATEYVSVDKRVTLSKTNLIAFVTSSSELARDMAKKGDQVTVAAAAEYFASGSVNMIASLVELSVSLKQQCTASSNGQTAIVTDVPPVLPHELAKLSPDEFAVILNTHRRGSLKDADIKAIREEHELLRLTFADDKDLQSALELCKQGTLFDVAWSLMDARFKSLEAFAGGLATVYPSCAEPLGDRTARDLVLCPKDMEEARLLLADFEVESALHAQQFQALTKLQEGIYDREINDKRVRKRQKTSN
ncbi:hypothetical protein V7S43_006615 [Phytophthora oleae]|uniref:Uncharacterized protein n=1 Tax=Phytophthora oleae TaxID=2107226 RepID=A0ABD3FS62_9STRA